MAPFEPSGGSFILRDEAPAPILVPENLHADARPLGSAALEFMRGEVLPAADRLQEQEPGLMLSLLRQAGALGLLGLEIPETYAGLGLAKSVACFITEAIALEPSFAVSHNVHTSVAMLPTLCFGDAPQRSRILPRLASGEWIGSFALSESQAGSDAMAARTRAVHAGGTYRLTGEKMWVTNAAFANLFTVFAKVDGQDGLTAFLVERDRPGLVVGREERKLGLKGSSTARVTLDSVEIPDENRLGEEGAGGRIALNALNLGRLKLAASSLGRAKELLGIAARYAVERRAFGKRISEFGLVEEKLARMTARIFAAESMLYRLAGCLDHAFKPIDSGSQGATGEYLAASQEYASECAILKFYCTETLDLCADECLQIHGGYGYTEEYAAARAWRDARVNRIYEGSNEINRYNAAHLIMRRADKKELDLSLGETEEARLLSTLRSVMASNREDQGALAAFADLAAELYARQSIFARVKLFPTGRNAEAAARTMAYYSFDAEPRRWASVRRLCSSCGGAGEALLHACSRRLQLAPLLDANTAARELARLATDAGAYPF